jgi:hypothetical protein
MGAKGSLVNFFFLRIQRIPRFSLLSQSPHFPQSPLPFRVVC